MLRSHDEEASFGALEQTAETRRDPASVGDRRIDGHDERERSGTDRDVDRDPCRGGIGGDDDPNRTRRALECGRHPGVGKRAGAGVDDEAGLALGCDAPHPPRREGQASGTRRRDDLEGSAGFELRLGSDLRVARNWGQRVGNDEREGRAEHGDLLNRCTVDRLVGEITI